MLKNNLHIEILIPMALHIIYATIGVIVQAGSIYSSISLSLYLLWGVFFLFKTNSNYRDPFLNAMNLFLIMEYSYFIFAERTYLTFFSGEIYGISKIISISLTMLPTYIFYYYGANNKITYKVFSIFTICFILLLIPKFFYEQQTRILAVSMRLGIDIEDATINTGYAFLEAAIFLPLIEKKKKLSLIMMAILAFFIVYSAKRGAILLYGIILLLYLPRFLKDSRKWILPLTIVLIIIAYFGFEYFSQSDYLNKRFEATMEGNMSKRDILYAKIWDYVWGVNLSLKSLLFGHGFLASKDIAGNVAHNDWLELLSGQGLLGISLFVNIFVQVWRRYRKIYDKDLKFIVGLLLIVWLIKTFFSMGFSELYFLYAILGFLMGQSYRYYRNNI